MKYVLVFLLCLAMLFTSACNLTKTEVKEDISVENSTKTQVSSDKDTFWASRTTDDLTELFDMALERAYTLILGTYIDKKEYESESRQKTCTAVCFSVSRVFMGSFEEKEIWVETSEDTIQAAGGLQKGQTYFLPVQYTSQIFMPELKYSSGYIIPVNADGTMQPYRKEGLKSELSFKNVDALLKYCAKKTDLSKNGKISGWLYTTSEDIQEIMQDAPCVFLGCFTEQQTAGSGTVYTCFSISKILKGKIPNNVYVDMADDKPVIYVWKKYEVKDVLRNKPYILACSFNEGENASAQTFSRKNAVIPMDDMVRANKAYTALGL